MLDPNHASTWEKEELADFIQIWAPPGFPGTPYLQTQRNPKGIPAAPKLLTLSSVSSAEKEDGRWLNSHRHEVPAHDVFCLHIDLSIPWTRLIRDFRQWYLNQPKRKQRKLTGRDQNRIAQGNLGAVAVWRLVNHFNGDLNKAMMWAAGIRPVYSDDKEYRLALARGQTLMDCWKNAVVG